MKNYKSSTFGVVINSPLGCSLTRRDLTQLGDMLNECSVTFFGALHDSDLNEQGVAKTPHIHFVLRFSSARSAISVLDTLTTIVGEHFDINEREQAMLLISIRPCYDLAKAIQYLTHKNDEDKFQYDYRFCITNNRQAFFEFYNKQELSADDLLEYILTNPRRTRLDIIRNFGLGTYNSYRGAINDLLSELSICGDDDEDNN